MHIRRLAVIRDVSAQRRARDMVDAAHTALAVRERQFSTLVENSPDLVARFDPAQRFVYASPVATHYTGLPAADFIGRGCAELGLPPELCGNWIDAARAVAANGQPQAVQFRLRTPGGELRTFGARLIPEVGDDGRIESVLSIATDVTERLRADAALRESRAHLEFALDAAGVGAWELDLRSRVARRSQRHDACFGHPEGLADWNAERFVSQLHPDDRAAIGARFEDAIRDGGDLHFECRVVWPDGSVHWIEVHGSTYRGDATATRMLGIISDVTERKLAEQALRDADRNKDEFLATLAHELRNPLAPIRNALALLRLPAAPKVHEDARNVIDRQLTQMVHLVDDLMDISRITQGKVTLRREPVDVAAAIQQAIETSRPMIESRGHALDLALPAAGELVVLADLTRLIQIISNLLTNAAKYTPEGGRIGVSAVRDASGAVPAVEIGVQDDGPGIAAELLPHVFDMFAQVSHTLERAQGGLGIGLALVRKFTELHGGTVRAESAGPGQGARFVLRLPLTGQPIEAPAPLVIAADLDTASSDRRVLVVDDNVDSAESLATLLEMLGDRTRIAYDGEDALDAAADFEPHAVLLDIGLPRLSGHEVARALRDRPGGDRLLLIAMSGWGQDEDRRRSQQAGFDHHLVKPLDLDQVTALLDAHRASPAG